MANAVATANSSQAVRQLSPASSAIGAASATPQPVPELMAARTRARRSGASDRETTSEKGGKTSPALAPATSRPAKSIPGLAAALATIMPATAQKPPAATTFRAPSRTESMPAAIEVTRYVM